MTDSPWTFDGESAASIGGSDAVTLVDGTTFMVCDRSGDIRGSGAQGLFMYDTRVLSRWQLTVNDVGVQPLSVTPNGPFSSTFVGRVPDSNLADVPITVVQRRHVGRGMREDLDVRYYGRETTKIVVRLAVASDFGSLFDVKSGRSVTDRSDSERLTNGLHIVAPVGSTVDATLVSCSTHPDTVQGATLTWEFTLAPGGSWTNCLLVGVAVDGTPIEPSYGCDQPVHEAIPVSRLRDWRANVTAVESNNADLLQAVQRASEDLGALRIFDPVHPDRVVVAAGAPWFMTLFGRDSLLASWMALPLDQQLAFGVLQELAAAQGKQVDAATEEQPGRILHEVRFDNSSARLLGGSNTYFGTVDATPLFVMLVAELARWTGFNPKVAELLPAVDRALEWIVDFGDRDGDGFVEYLRSDPSGLENQGWKDSWDGIRHADGSVATGPIALCEVQGYVYAALRGRADLARAVGEPESVVSAWEARAERLKILFDERFWLDDLGWYAIGLDGDKQTIRSLTSNIGHLLWTGIVRDDRAQRVADQLAGPSMFTGWGVRTLSSDAAGYNPLSYHCGSVWPHDTALAVAGLARYGLDREAHLISNGLLAASGWSDGRLPELFAGFDRDDLTSPVPYPASCSPQAWAAAAPLLLVRAMLGLDPDMLAGTLRVRPRLPPGTTRLRLSNVPLGDDRLDIAVTDGDVAVAGLGDHITLDIDAPARRT